MCGHLAVVSLKAERLPINSSSSTSNKGKSRKRNKSEPAFDSVKFHTENVQQIIKVTTLFGG